MHNKTRWIEATISRKLLQLICATAILFSSSEMAIADTVGFNPDPANVGIGDSFSVDIVGIDFTELSGGVIDLGFDSNLLRVDSVSIDPFFDFLPDGGGPAVGNVWPGISFDVFVNDPAVVDFTIATINLTALAGGIPNLVILGSSVFFSTTDQLFPSLDDGTVNVALPVPAAVWLFGSGLLGLVGVARRKAA